MRILILLNFWNLNYFWRIKYISFLLNIFRYSEHVVRMQLIWESCKIIFFNFLMRILKLMNFWHFKSHSENKIHFFPNIFRYSEHVMRMQLLWESCKINFILFLWEFSFWWIFDILSYFRKIKSNSFFSEYFQIFRARGENAINMRRL